MDKNIENFNEQAKEYEKEIISQLEKIKELRKEMEKTNDMEILKEMHPIINDIIYNANKYKRFALDNMRKHC